MFYLRRYLGQRLGYLSVHFFWFILDHGTEILSAPPEVDGYPWLFDLDRLNVNRPTRWARCIHRAPPRNGRMTGKSCRRLRGAARRKEASDAC